MNVGYFSYHADKLNSFQLVLIDRSDVNPRDFDIEFNYDHILWETGDAAGGSGGLGGYSARAGYANGAAATYELPGSAVNGNVDDDTGLAFSKFGLPVVNLAWDAAFIAKLEGGGVTGDNDTGMFLWNADSSQTELAAREGAEPVGATGAQFKQIKSLGLADEGWAYFTASLVQAGAVTKDNDVGLWGTRLGGTTFLLLREGDTMTVDGSAKTVKSFTVLKAASGSPAQRRSFSNTGHVVVLVKFADGSSAIAKCTMP